jgi:hypothetical protein
MSIPKVSYLFQKGSPKSEFGGNESEFGKICTKIYRNQRFVAINVGLRKPQRDLINC